MSMIKQLQLLNGAAAQYLNEVNKNIVCSGSLKKPFLKQLGTEADYFCMDHCNADMEMLSERFGSPQEVANTFMTELRTHTAEHYKIRKRTLYRCMAGILLIFLALAAFVVHDAYITQQKLYDEAYVDSVTYKVASSNYE